MSSTRTQPGRKRSPRRNRRGAIVVLFAVIIVAMLALLALSIDVGFLADARTESQRAADAGALAGAGALTVDVATAEPVAVEFVRQNPICSRVLDAGDIDVEIGQWDRTSRLFAAGGDSPSAVRVTTHYTNAPAFFSRIFGSRRVDIHAQSVAVFRPRDIVVVLDYSSSMNDDSQLGQIGKLGRNAVETNLFDIYSELGAPTYGTMTFRPVTVGSTSISTVKKTLGLDKVPYPYPVGSWDEFINYVQTSPQVRSAGYKNQYGCLTLIQYWLDRRPMAHETPDLWKTSEQPITAVKDSLTVFMSYLRTVKANDRVGLAVYTSQDGTAVLESGLTHNYDLVESISRHRQAGHYEHFTNIGAGLNKARLELEKNGRTGALKMVVLMTDGLANRPTNPTIARNLVLSETQKCQEDGFPVVTISLGADADTGLLQEVADATGGVHFNIPGGQPVKDYTEDLKAAFRKIADNRPLMLVQ